MEAPGRARLRLGPDPPARERTEPAGTTLHVARPREDVRFYERFGFEVIAEEL
jgi:hypothetical protein